ncbi:glycosyltransferase family 2 protein [Paenibacillus pasadenensis]|uniref:glycosyltransferase family 2 protein n=1 Tax=Paenibacillus pasadenensis TaxID=217090 RepID=UPI0009FFDE42|nr:glycosyltransferase family 2 protein [Paenibacillus pasadenensis]
MARVLAIVPAFNEEKNLISLYRKLKSVELEDHTFDIIIINDCSTDRTKEVCDVNGIPVINLPCNLGIGGAVQSGYKYALKNDYDIALQVDGDGQHDPSYITKLIAPIINGESDMVIGSRYIQKRGFQSSKMRRLGIRYFTLLLQATTGQKITDPTSGFRACNKKMIREFARYYPVDYPEPESIMFSKRNRFVIKEIAVEMKARTEGHSSITSLKSVYYMSKVSLAIIIDKMRKEMV